MLAEGWYASVDGYVLKDHPHELYSQSDIALNAAQSVVVGANSLDGLLVEMDPSTSTTPNTKEGYVASVQKYFDGAPEVQSELLTHYYPPSAFPAYSYGEESWNSYQLAWWTMNADVCNICPAFKMAEQVLCCRLRAGKYCPCSHWGVMTVMLIY